MSKLVRGVLALVMVAAFALPASADNMKMSGMKGSSMSSTMMTMKCAKGKHWVKAYTKKNGTKVKGYCR